MWVFILPAVLLGIAALVAVAFYLARPGVARGGPHPDDVPGVRE